MLTWADAGALLAVFVWGVSFPVLKGLMTVMSPLTLMVARGLVSCLVLAIALRRTGGWRAPTAEDVPALLAPGLIGFTVNQMFVGVIYAGAAGGALGSLLWYAAVRRLGAARTAIYANMESFFAVLAAALLLGERVAVTSLVGGAAVVAGVLLTRRRG